jgi:hypothetical protein
LFAVPQHTVRLIVEFAAAGQQNSDTTDPAATIKGLLFDSTKATRAQTPTLTAEKSPLPDNSKAALKFRSEKSIKDSIARHIPRLEALYKKHLKLHETMSGTLWVTFSVSPSGVVAAASIRASGIAEKDFLSAFQNYIIRELHFTPIPENIGAMSFDFPFEFSPEN